MRDGSGGSGGGSFSPGVPLISFSGWSGCGKTTFLETVVGMLDAEGICAAVIKHHAHATDIDVEGKDSWRYSKAGASPVVVSTPEQFALTQRVERERTLDELVHVVTHAGGVDVIFAEGFRREARFLVEVSRAGHNDTFRNELDEIRVLVTDNGELAQEAAARGIPTFALDDFEGFIAFIKETFSVITEL